MSLGFPLLIWGRRVHSAQPESTGKAEMADVGCAAKPPQHMDACLLIACMQKLFTQTPAYSSLVNLNMNATRTLNLPNLYVCLSVCTVF